MDVRFATASLSELDSDPEQNRGYAQDAIRGFRKVMRAIRAALDERDLYHMKSLRFEKLKGDRADQMSLRLNDQWRLIVQIVPGEPKNAICILGIEDYH